MASGLRLLITCPSVSARTGLEVFVTEVAREMANRGWLPTIYAPTIGPLADEIRAAGISVVTELTGNENPDLIHGTFFFETISACLLYPKTPLLFQTHAALIWQAFPPKIANLRKILSVSAACNEALEEAGFAADSIETSLNFVDTRLFKPRSPLPDIPRRALVFSNYATESNYLVAVRRACEKSGLLLEAIGSGVGSPCANPELVLGEYDIVFARGRAAIEAMAVGCAVIPCDQEGVADIVTMDNVHRYRDLNFGFKILQGAHSSDNICRQINDYDPHKARRVMEFIRREASLDRAMDLLEVKYQQTLRAPSMGYTQRSYLVADLERYMTSEIETGHAPPRYSPFLRAYYLAKTVLGSELIASSTGESTRGRPNAWPSPRARRTPEWWPWKKNR